MSSEQPPREPSAGPPSKPPRSALTVRDMLGALAVLVLLVLAVGGLTRACSFSPGGPTVDPSRLPTVDAPAALRELAPDVPFPVRIPDVPAKWSANSTEIARVEDGSRVVRTGYLTSSARYLRLLQSTASEAALLTMETGGQATPGRGVVEVDGQRWVAYGAGGAEPIWITEVASPDGAPVRLVITGSGSEREFRTLATAAVAGELA